MFVVFVCAIALLMLTVTGCAQAASPTKNERSAYAAGVVAGSYGSYIFALMHRLHAAGVPSHALPELIDRGCRGVTLEQVTGLVLLSEPRAKNEDDAVVQTYQIMDQACASLRLTGT